MGIKNLMGSLAKDLFKWWHKQIPDSAGWYACDIDLSLLDRNGILCIQDYKHGNDNITWAEQKTYRDLFNRGLPTYIIKDTAKRFNDVIMFNKGNLYKNLCSLGIPENLINDIMDTNIEKTLKTETMNTMHKNLSVWDYKPDSKNYVSKCISNNYVEWETELRDRRKS
jgi:hypothetical protein